MKAFITKLSLSALTIALLAQPAGAGAAYLVPPGNSAATQYTEAFPTARGPKNSAAQTNHEKSRNPSRVIGTRNSRRLAAQGAEGRALAELVAETAPPSLLDSHALTKGAERQPSRQPDKEHGSSDNGAASSRPSGGSSGLGAVMAGATGLSSGHQGGPLLPLAIVATVAWLLAYTFRQRKTSTQ